MKTETATMRQRIEDAYRYGGGRHSGLEPVMKQIINELERIEARIDASASPQASEPAPQVVGWPAAITEDMVFAAFEAFELTGHFTTLHATRKALEAALASKETSNA